LQINILPNIIKHFLNFFDTVDAMSRISYIFEEILEPMAYENARFDKISKCNKLYSSWTATKE